MTRSFVTRGPSSLTGLIASDLLLQNVVCLYDLISVFPRNFPRIGAFPILFKLDPYITPDGFLDILHFLLYCASDGARVFSISFTAAGRVHPDSAPLKRTRPRQSTITPGISLAFTIPSPKCVEIPYNRVPVYYFLIRKLFPDPLVIGNFFDFFTKDDDIYFHR